jgi:hypothetical protein
MKAVKATAGAREESTNMFKRWGSIMSQDMKLEHVMFRPMVLSSVLTMSTPPEQIKYTKSKDMHRIDSSLKKK